MPLYTTQESLTKLKKINNPSKYTKIQHNDNGEWEFAHRLVSNYIQDKPKNNEVIHHVDFNRFNNNPKNLQIVDKNEHIKIHSTSGWNSWKYGDVETHRKNLSIAGKKFFQTEEGMKRREEISLMNKVQGSPGLAKGRESMKKQREIDKLELSKEEYYEKWTKPRIKGLLKSNELAIAKTLSYDFDHIKSTIDSIFHRNIIGNEIVLECQNKISNDIKHKTLNKILKYHGYKSISHYLASTYKSDYKWCNKKTNLSNHKVIKVVFRYDLIDTGTITVDGDEIYHSYHNFALTSGVFVMNSGGRATEITTLPGGMNLGQLDDVTYFKNKLYEALNVPVTRLNPEVNFNLGRSTEITRDEIQFAKFISRLRGKFSVLFLKILEKQLILKGIITPEEWDDFKNSFKFKFSQDNYYEELKETEIMRERISMLRDIDDYAGKYYSHEQIRKKILRQTDDDIKLNDKEIAQELNNPQYNPPEPESEPEPTPPPAPAAVTNKFIIGGKDASVKPQK